MLPITLVDTRRDRGRVGACLPPRQRPRVVGRRSPRAPRCLTWFTAAAARAGGRGVDRGGRCSRALGREAAAPRARSRARSSACYKSVLPQMSQTEQEALDAGSVWWDADLFSGKPDWKKMLAYPAAKLTAEEQAFVDGPVEELCGMLDEWDINHERMDLSPEAWKFIRDKGFLGIIIPKSYGGLGFSAFAHSEIVTKISTRSGAAAVTVMVPNSLGPAELLIHYGTEEQKNHYLPRLAKGQEIPCFALTNPEAGSDAGVDPRLRHRLQGPARGQGSPRHPPHLGEALHHARARWRPSSASPSSSSIPRSSWAARRTSASRSRSSRPRTRA